MTSSVVLMMPGEFSRICTVYIVFCQVTADGSVDCANEPGEQEQKVAALLYTEVVTAVSLLCPRGSLVLKMFTLFEHTSICLLYIICCTFERVQLKTN